MNIKKLEDDIQLLVKNLDLEYLFKFYEEMIAAEGKT